jgi:hypothetical protein
MALRPSQVETLRVVRLGCREGARLEGVAAALRVSEEVAEKRLLQLRSDPRHPLIDVVLARYFPFGPRYKFYRLTQLGKEALESSDA